jgi:hypothetical protein
MELARLRYCDDAVLVENGRRFAREDPEEDTTS